MKNVRPHMDAPGLARKEKLPFAKGPPLPSTARSMIIGQFFSVLTGACQFGHGVGGFTTNFY